MLTLVQYVESNSERALHLVGIYTSAERALEAIRRFDARMKFREPVEVSDADFLRNHARWANSRSESLTENTAISSPSWNRTKSSCLTLGSQLPGCPTSGPRLGSSAGVKANLTFCSGLRISVALPLPILGPKHLPCAGRLENGWYLSF